MTDTLVDRRRHNADYGFDGSYHNVPPAAQAVIVGGAGAALLASATRSIAKGRPIVAAAKGAAGASIIGTAAAFIHTTRVGKFEVWARILDDLALRGDETVLDLGCGRDAMLLTASRSTPDITDLPFDDNSVDVVVSSLVVHNISIPADREKAISEVARVLRPGGRLVLADIWATRRHVRQLRELGWTDAWCRNLGWRMWWGPGLGTHLVTATKPG